MLLQMNIAADSLATTVAESAEGVEAVTEETISILELIANGGAAIMIPLGILFVAAIYIFFERFMSIQKASKEDPNFMNQIRENIHDGKIEAAQNLCSSTEGPFARMIGKGIKRIGKPLGDISTAIENDGRLEVYQMEKNLDKLATIAGAAPMIGFLGTVIGMINTFHEMSTAGNSVQIDQLAGGIMQAMVTTATGLVIGIIAYVGYNVLVSKVESVVNKMEARTIEFMDVLQEPA